ncbi:MAG: lytic transglycosylase domain-containing protein [Deltaproteobacteria bacterium]|nr:lytic transglycosylase domain-containing protein [Deltaproteobacteria bacterium]
MRRLIVPGIGAILLFVFPAFCNCEARVQPNSIEICSVIINELSEGKISFKQAKEIAMAIANAGNKNFGKITCGDMWLFMSIVYVESGFRNNLINYQNCRGMFQVHAPSWASKFRIHYSDLLNLQTNADCGIQIFKYYLSLYRDVVPALSAYNSDHPYAAKGYARMVLSVRKRIKERYRQIYRLYHDAPVLVAQSRTK